MSKDSWLLTWNAQGVIQGTCVHTDRHTRFTFDRDLEARHSGQQLASHKHGLEAGIDVPLSKPARRICAVDELKSGASPSGGDRSLILVLNLFATSTA